MHHPTVINLESDRKLTHEPCVGEEEPPFASGACPCAVNLKLGLLVLALLRFCLLAF